MTENSKFKEEFGFTPIGSELEATRTVEVEIVKARLALLKAVVDDNRAILAEAVAQLDGDRSKLDLLQLHVTVKDWEERVMQHTRELNAATALAEKEGF